MRFARTDLRLSLIFTCTDSGLGSRPASIDLGLESRLACIALRHDLKCTCTDLGLESRLDYVDMGLETCTDFEDHLSGLGT